MKNWNKSLCLFGTSLAIGVSISLGQSTDGGMVVAGLTNNTLTPQEQADGYQLLWDGKDLNGWMVNDNATNPSTALNGGTNWSIVKIPGLENGESNKSANVDSNMLEINDNNNGAGPSLFTNDSTYLNFDWKIEWQSATGTFSPGGTITNDPQQNSGLLIHFRISSGTNNNYSAPEYQVCNSGWTSEWKTLTETAGCNYDMLPLLPSRKNPDNSPSWCRAEGHWNQSRIISYGTRTAHYGNGLRLMEYQILSPAWNKAYNAPSKYQGLGIYATLHSGSIFIQEHGQPYMKFRDIRIKRLTQNPWGPTSPYLDKDSAANGDSTLIDTLTFADDLFPAPSAISPYTIQPKLATKVVSNSDGLFIQFSQPGDYSLSLEDVRGVRYSVHQVHNSDRFYLPGEFSHSPRILTIWSGDKKIRESVVGQ